MGSNKDRIGVTEIELLKVVVEGTNALIDLEKAICNQATDVESKFPAPRFPPWNDGSDKNSLKQRVQRAAMCKEVIDKIGPAPQFIVIKGRKGANNIINGLYRLGRDTFNGRVYYEKCSFRMGAFIRWHKKGMWIIDENLGHDMKGSAFNKSQQPYPHLASKSWAVFDEGNKSFVEDENVKVADHSDGIVVDKQ